MAEWQFRRPALGGAEALSDRIDIKRGGRPPFQPQSFQQARERLAPMIATTRDTVTALPQPLRAKRVVVEATILPNYLANSHYPEALFERAGLVPVGTRGARRDYRTRTRVEADAPTKTYLLSVEDLGLQRLASVLEQESSSLSDTVRLDVAKLDDFGLVARDHVLRMGTGEVTVVEGKIALEAVLHPQVRADGQADEAEQQAVLAKWVAYVEALGGEVRVDWIRREDSLTFLPTLLPADKTADAALFNPLRTLRPMPRVTPIPDPFRVVGSVSVQPSATRPASDQRIAVFDGGVDRSAPALTPFVTETDLTNGQPPHPDGVRHGTTVTSAALYGSLSSDDPTAVPPAWVDVFRVWPPPADQRADVHLYWTLKRIEEQVCAGDHTLVSLSLGPELNVEEDAEPHAWTLALDRLAVDEKVLFLVAAGNQGTSDAESGANRIGVPADLANGLSIGACDRPYPETWQRAQYSSVGPGRPGARVAPVAVAHGGDIEGGAPFGCVLPGGRRGHSEGTSLATPAVARGVAELADALGDRATVNALRAFVVHHADRHPTHPCTEIGYGRLPESFAAQLDCPPHRATVLYEGALQRGESITLRMPLPDGVLDAVKTKTVKLRWTLTFTTPIDGADAVEYGRSGIEIYFRPDADNFELRRDDDPDVTINRRERPEVFAAYVRDAWVPADRPKTRPKKGYAPEVAKRQRDGKWESIIRVDDSMKAKTLWRPAFDLSFVAREHGDLTDAHAPVTLPYALVATLQAPAGVPLYDRIRAAYPVLTPLVAELPVTVST
jgi:hypothetical protein